MKILTQSGELKLYPSPFTGWDWVIPRTGYIFRAAKDTPDSYYRLYAVLATNVFRWIGNKETLTECVQWSDEIAHDDGMLSKYFYE